MLAGEKKEKKKKKSLVDLKVRTRGGGRGRVRVLPPSRRPGTLSAAFTVFQCCPSEWPASAKWIIRVAPMVRDGDGTGDPWERGWSSEKRVVRAVRTVWPILGLEYFFSLFGSNLDGDEGLAVARRTTGLGHRARIV